MPWTRAVRQNLLDLSRYLERELASLGSPIDNAQSWKELMLSYPAEWSELVGRFFFQGLGPFVPDEPEKGAKLLKRGGAFGCQVCGESGFQSQKALEQHTRVKHGQKCAMNFFVADARCPVCNKQFADRLRVIAHLSETRVRSKSGKPTCRDRVLAGEVPRLDDSVVTELHGKARVQRAEARRAGHTRPVVPKHSQAHKRPLEELYSIPRRRVRCKTSPEGMSWKLVQPSCREG